MAKGATFVHIETSLCGTCARPHASSPKSGSCFGFTAVDLPGPRESVREPAALPVLADVVRRGVKACRSRRLIGDFRSSSFGTAQAGNRHVTTRSRSIIASCMSPTGSAERVLPRRARRCARTPSAGLGLPLRRRAAQSAWAGLPSRSRSARLPVAARQQRSLLRVAAARSRRRSPHLERCRVPIECRADAAFRGQGQAALASISAIPTARCSKFIYVSTPQLGAGRRVHDHSARSECVARRHAGAEGRRRRASSRRV